MADLSRRDVLKLVRDGFLYLSGALALGGLLRFLDFQAGPVPQTEFDLGPAANYPIGSRTVLAEIPTLLIHSEQGFTAISLVCTHLGCIVKQSADGFTCPCHGSKFDTQGNVMHGPANKQLQSMRIEQMSNEHLYIFTN